MKTRLHIHAQRMALRIVAIFVIVNGLSLMLPQRWIDLFLVWSGLEHLPQTPIVRWLLVGSALLMLSFGVLIWVIASDVVRYQPVVLTIVAIFLASAPLTCWIDVVAGLPRWWCVADFASFLLAGAVPLVCRFWPASHNQAMQPTAPRSDA